VRAPVPNELVSNAVVSRAIIVSVNINQFFSVAKIAELLRSPQRRSRVVVQSQEMIVEKEMF